MEQIRPPSPAEIQTAENEHDLSNLCVIIGILFTLSVFFVNSLDGIEKLNDSLLIGKLAMGFFDIYSISSYFRTKLALDDISEQSRNYLKTLKK